ncbi:MAG: hypothetical protein M1482_13675 [Chloroflexi bacterium]|nr:hypothetical protein [Chloroflexota bacterium]
MFDNYKLNKEVKAAIEKATAVLDERKRIREAIAKAELDLPLAEAALLRAGEELSSVAADSALLANGRSTLAAREACAEARTERDLIASRLEGLRKKLTASDDVLLAAEDELAAVRARFSRSIVAQFKEDLLKVAEPFAEMLRLGRGLEMGLDCELHINYRILDPEDPRRDLIPLFKKTPEEGYGWRERWRENPTAARAYDAVADLTVAAKKMKNEAKDVRDQRHQKATREEAQRIAKNSAA